MTEKVNKDSLMSFRLTKELHQEVKELGLKLGPELRDFVSKRVKTAKKEQSARKT